MVVAAERRYIDEVILPHDTRKRIARALQMLRHKRLTNPWKKRPATLDDGLCLASSIRSFR